MKKKTRNKRSKIKQLNFKKKMKPRKLTCHRVQKTTKKTEKKQ